MKTAQFPGVLETCPYVYKLIQGSKKFFLPLQCLLLFSVGARHKAYALFKIQKLFQMYWQIKMEAQN